ncbi:hypothetical protein MLD38_009274 [Melastoma candidum]|uniref:Uncharacterized protein n=1 Tax=Melastoma candidum TaxID=119954 RepID=A0ACB9RYF4_9MYRT|nr:hypothetical protein MLD38_009274 [Melastoma candidum]
MENGQQQQRGGSKNPTDGKKVVDLEGLPMKDSPYLQYDNLEDYKLKAYGTQGHQEPVHGRGAGSTDAPTLSGANVSSESQARIADEAVRHRLL